MLSGSTGWIVDIEDFFHYRMWHVVHQADKLLVWIYNVLFLLVYRGGHCAISCRGSWWVPIGCRYYEICIHMVQSTICLSGFFPTNSMLSRSIIWVIKYFLVDAVYAVAHALHNIIKDECGEPFHLCEALKPAPLGPQLLKYIRNVSFTGKDFYFNVLIKKFTILISFYYKTKHWL